MKTHHVGYLVKNIDQSLAIFKNIGFDQKCNIIDDFKRKIKIVFISKDNYLLELISPTSDESIVSKLLSNMGNSPYHIAYESTEFDSEIESLKRKGFILVQKPEKAIAFENKRVVFMYNSNLGLVELIEK